MVSKKYDLCVKTGEYERDGQTKGRFENIGAVFADDNGPFILLKRTFNPAGVTAKEGADSIRVYCFKQKG